MAEDETSTRIQISLSGAGTAQGSLLQGLEGVNKSWQCELVWLKFSRTVSADNWSVSLTKHGKIVLEDESVCASKMAGPWKNSLLCLLGLATDLSFLSLQRKEKEQLPRSPLHHHLHPRSRQSAGSEWTDVIRTSWALPPCFQTWAGQGVFLAA